LCLKKTNATGNPGCTLFNLECTISAGNTLRIGPGRVRGQHISGGRQAAGSQRADSLGSCATQPACYSLRWDRHTYGSRCRLMRRYSGGIINEMKIIKRQYCGRLGSRVVSVLDSGAVGPGFKSQPRRCRVTVLSKLFTPVVPLFTKQRHL